MHHSSAFILRRIPPDLTQVWHGTRFPEINSPSNELLELTPSTVSHHLRGLRQKHIVEARRDGKEVYYSVIDPHIVALFQQGVDHVQENHF